MLNHILYPTRRRFHCRRARCRSPRRGVAVVAAAGVRVAAVNLGVQPTTFECVDARITSSTSRCLVVVVVYRPASAAVTANFFTELADMLDRVSTFVDLLVLAGDLNLRLERQNDPHTVEFNDLLPWRVKACSNKSSMGPTTSAEHWTWYVRAVTFQLRLSTSLMSASPIIVCCAGHSIFTARPQFTRRPLADPGGRSTRMSSWPTCSRHRCVTNDSGKA